MDRWRRLTSLFRRRVRRQGDPNAILLHVRCTRCGEVIRIRADRRWDLVEELDDPAVAHVLHKDVLGTRCNRMMSIHVAFDRGGAILRQDAEGAAFVTAEEYQAFVAGRGRA
jgi:hypothetical protein